MEIIKCTTENLDSIALFYDKVTKHLEEHINYPKWTRGAYPAMESVRQAITDGAQYACMDGGKVAGAFVLNDDPQGDYSAGDWSCELKIGEFMVIHALAADPETYHSGIGGKMVEYCIKTAKEQGYGAIRLDVVPTNTPARGLYEKMGFLFAGEKNLVRGIDEIPLFALYELNF